MVRLGSEIQGQKLITRKMREGAKNAQAKLNYLLGLDPESELVLFDRHMVSFTLVNAGLPVQILVDASDFQGAGHPRIGGTAQPDRGCPD